MELVDRYLHAVKFWLPRKQKDDIIAELSEDLRSQIEDQEAALGRKLSDAEVESILKRCGSPMAVAGRFLPQQSLIGPALFPIYSVIIRSLLLYFLLPWMLLWMGVAIFSPDFRADHPGAALFLSLGPWWRACTYSLFFNTLIFALLDRSQARLHLVNDWNPRALPQVRDRNAISRGGTIFELTVVVATLATWIQLDAFRRVFHIFGTTITLSSCWPDFFWALVIVSLAGVGISCMNLSNPRWTRLTASLRLGIDFYSFGLFYWLFRANMLQSFSVSGVSVTEAADFVRSFNYWMASSAVWVLVVGAIVLFFDIRRILRVGPTVFPGEQQAAAQ
jgi:hypothetical protein